MRKIVFKILGIVGILTTLTTNVMVASNTFGDTSVTEGYDVIGTGIGDEGDTNNVRILKVIKKAVNRVLAMLGLVALILCLWGGFQMLTAAGDDSKVKSGTKILKNAFIGLVVIALSWLFVTAIFRIINYIVQQ